MIIDFDNIREKRLPHFQGGEKEANFRIFSDDKEKILKGRLVPGASIGLHTHKEGSEIIYVLKGTGKVICDGEIEIVFPGMVHYCPQGSNHSLINDGLEDLFFFAVVTLY